MSTTATQTYLRTKVLTASPEQLRLMLFDGAIRFAQQAREGLVKKDYEAVFNGITRCQNILVELMTALRPEHAPELCDKLNALYTFMITRMMAAGSERNPAIIDEVIKLLEYERETWVLLLEQLARENSAAGNIAATPSLQGDAPPHAYAPPVSEAIIGGSVSVEG